MKNLNYHIKYFPKTSRVVPTVDLDKNLNFISKILERVVAVQLQTHLDEAGLMTAFKSVYRKHHSTESALLYIQNDILLNMAKGLSKVLPFWIYLPHSIPLTTPFSWTDLMFTMESMNQHLAGPNHTCREGHIRSR